MTRDGWLKRSRGILNAEFRFKFCFFVHSFSFITPARTRILLAFVVVGFQGESHRNLKIETILTKAGEILTAFEWTHLLLARLLSSFRFVGCLSSLRILSGDRQDIRPISTRLKIPLKDYSEVQKIAHFRSATPQL